MRISVCLAMILSCVVSTVTLADIPRPSVGDSDSRRPAPPAALLNEYRILVRRVMPPGEPGRLIIPKTLLREATGAVGADRPVKRGGTIVAGTAVSLAVVIAGLLAAKRRSNGASGLVALAIGIGILAGAATVWANMAPPITRDRANTELERLFAELGGGERVLVEVRDVDLPYIQLWLPAEPDAGNPGQAPVTGSAPTTRPG